MLHLFRVLAIAVAGLLAALMIYAGNPLSLWWWGASIPFAAWVIGGAIAPFLLATRLDRFGATPVLLVLFLISNVLAITGYVDAFFISKSSTGALILIFLPLYQWVSFTVVAFALAVAVTIKKCQRHS